MVGTLRVAQGAHTTAHESGWHFLAVRRAINDRFASELDVRAMAIMTPSGPGCGSGTRRDDPIPLHPFKRALTSARLRALGWEP
jgi:hypothetical protein